MKLFHKPVSQKHRKRKPYSSPSRYSVDVHVSAGSGTRKPFSSSYQKKKKR